MSLQEISEILEKRYTKLKKLSKDCELTETVRQELEDCERKIGDIRKSAMDACLSNFVRDEQTNRFIINEVAILRNNNNVQQLIHKYYEKMVMIKLKNLNECKLHNHRINEMGCSREGQIQSLKRKICTQQQLLGNFKDRQPEDLIQMCSIS